MIDMRTMAGRKEEIRQQVRAHHGFSIFWITEARRAGAADQLVDAGEIIYDEPRTPYPWIGCRLRAPEEEKETKG